LGHLTSTGLSGKAHLDFIAGAKRAYEQARQRDPSLAPLLPGRGGRVQANGAIRVFLPTTRGEAVYVVRPSNEWRYALVGTTPRRPVVRGAAQATTPVARVRRAIDAALAELVDIEARARAAESPPNAA
jgi:hypothetical protein